MSWTWLTGKGNRKFFGRINLLGELMEAGSQWIKHWDRLEFAKTSNWTFPDHVPISHGTCLYQGILPVLISGGRNRDLLVLVWCNPLSSHGRTAERKSVSRSLAFVLFQRGLSSLLCVNKLLQYVPAEGLLLQLKLFPQHRLHRKMMFSSSLLSFF